jgi:hypothetical protein
MRQRLVEIFISCKYKYNLTIVKFTTFYALRNQQEIYMVLRSNDKLSLPLLFNINHLAPIITILSLVYIVPKMHLMGNGESMFRTISAY